MKIIFLEHNAEEQKKHEEARQAFEKSIQRFYEYVQRAQSESFWIASEKLFCTNFDSEWTLPLQIIAQQKTILSRNLEICFLSVISRIILGTYLHSFMLS